MAGNESRYIEFIEALVNGCDPVDGTPFDESSVFSDYDVQLALFLARRIIEDRRPGSGDSETKRNALLELSREVEVFPSAMEAAEAAASVSFECDIKRFAQGNWFQVDSPGTECPTCESVFLAFRSPYTTKVGTTYFYWALACPACRTLMEPAQLGEEERKKVYRGSKNRPIPRD